MTQERGRILTGDTPTGKLHVGHYVGTLENRVNLQDTYETFIILADLHALTTLADEPHTVAHNTEEVLRDNLAVGLDPERVVFFIESGIPEMYELAAIFSMYVSHNRALRNPTIKDEIRDKGQSDTFSLGFINYPIYQAADILSLRANLVPVGIDQQAHLEQSRELARDMNRVTGRDIFPIPEAKIGRVGKLPGTDGRPKMSKSLGNAIYLSDSSAEVQKKVAGMYTDPNRIHATDPGTVEGNPVFEYLDAFGTTNDQDMIADLKTRYTAGKVGDVEVKQYLTEVLERFLSPIRERRESYTPTEVQQILARGTETARAIVADTLREVREGLGLNNRIA